MKREDVVKHFPYFVPLIVAVAGVAACGAPHEASRKESPAVNVAVARAVREDFPATFEAGGVLRARATATIASRLMAPVSAVHVRAGDRVRRGAPLVTLDTREIRANNSRAAAALQAAVDAARASEADVQAAESNVVLARATYGRIDTLHQKRSATPHELDQALAALSEAEARLSGTKARAAGAAAARDAARAGLEAAEIGVSYGVLSAPFDGVITERMVDPGSLATPGTPLLMIEDPSVFRLEVQLDQTRAARVTTGTIAGVRIDNSGPGWTTGRVVEVARVDAASHSFLAKVELADTSGFRSGSFGRARFSGPSRSAVAVPAGAVVRRGQLAFVFVVLDGVVRLRPVTTGAVSTERIEILAGLHDGESVVLNPPATLTDGVRVAGTAAVRRPLVSPATSGGVS